MLLDDIVQHYLDEDAKLFQVDNFLAHYGVKGMHWGVHHQRNLELHTRVANGTGSKLDRYRAFNQMSAVDLVRHKGSVKSFSTEQAAKLQAIRDRADAGTSTKRDKVFGALGVTGEDVARKIANKPRQRKV